MSTTRLLLRQQLGEQETGLATLGIATATGSTTTVVASGLAGAYSASRWSRGTAMRITSITGGTVASAQNTSLDSYAPATGTITVLPAILAPVAADTFEVWDAVETVAEVDQAIDDALTMHCFRWVPVPLTKVTDGDMGDTAVTGLWTASAAGITPTKVNVAFPDKVGRRYLRTLHTIASKYVYSATMNAVGGDTWRLSAICKPAVGTAILTPYDVTNSANITLVGDGGSYAGFAPKHLDNTFTIPATCKQIRIHVGGTGATDDIHWTNIIAYQQDETQFVLPMRIANEKKIGNVLYRTGDDVEDFRFEPYCESGRHAGISAEMAGVVVRLSHAPGTGSPAYVEEKCTYDALSADTSTTDCDPELVLACATYRLMKRLANKGYALPTPQGYLAPSAWRLRRDEALREMQGKQASLGAQSKTVFR